MVNLTYNAKLVFFQPEDKEKLIEVLEAQREAFNYGSKIKYDNNLNNSLVIFHSYFYKSFREHNPKVPAQVVIRAENDCLASYRSVKSNEQIIDKPIEKKKLSMRLDKKCFSNKNGIFSIVSLGKRVKCKPLLYPKLEEFFGKYVFLDPLIFERNGEVYIAMTFEIPTLLPKPTSVAVGIDLGCRCFAATSEGVIYQNKKFNREKRKLRFLKRKLRAKVRALNSESARKHLKKLKRKERNKNKNFTHHLANKLLKEIKADTLVLEDLDIKSMRKKKHKNDNKNYISQISMYLLRTILTYKALLYGKQVTTVSPWYTSQMDHRTRKTDGIRKGCRYYGKDGFIMHADINAAINIAVKSKRPISCMLNATYGQAVVNQPIVGERSPTSHRL